VLLPGMVIVGSSGAPNAVLLVSDLEAFTVVSLTRVIARKNRLPGGSKVKPASYLRWECDYPDRFGTTLSDDARRA
jgi:hypothetical protein